MSEETIPSGAEGIEFLMRAFAEEPDLTRRHAVALRTIHCEFGRGVDLEMSCYVMQICRDLVAQGVPCRRSDIESYAGYAFITYTWPEVLRDETTELMRLYIRAGYFRLNDQVRAFGITGDIGGACKDGRSLLEACIRNGNVPAAIVLVEEGERTDLAPMTTFMNAADKPVAPHRDMLELAQDWWSDQTFVSALTAASMHRHIQVSSIAQSTAMPRARARRPEL